MSSSTILNEKFISTPIKNSDRRVRRLSSDFADHSVSNPDETLKRIKQDIESFSVVTTLKQSNHELIELIMSRKLPLVIRRNKILDNPFKFFLAAFYKNELRNIDEEIDKLDLELYSLEKEDLIKESDVQKLISSAEDKLRKYSQYL